jgi:hypothetical protein
MFCFSLRGPKYQWVLENPESKIKLVTKFWVIDSLNEGSILSDTAYDLIPVLMKPQAQSPSRLICGFARHELFQGSGFILGSGIDAAEIEQHGGKVLHSESCGGGCQNVYVIEDRTSDDFANLRHTPSRHCQFRTPRWLRDCFTVQSSVFPPETARWRALLHSPWPAAAMARSTPDGRPFSIAITGAPVPAAPFPASRSPC